MKHSLLNEFVEQLRSLNTGAGIKDFLNGILTPQELLELPKRLAIVKMLKKGIPQQQIAKELGVGIATVTRGSKEIQKGRFKQF